jgi:hypothetical protein
MPQILSHDYKMSINMSWRRKSMKDAIDTGKSISHQKTSSVYIPSSLEMRFISIIKRVRQLKLLVFRDDVMSWATHLISSRMHSMNKMSTMGMQAMIGSVDFYAVTVS